MGERAVVHLAVLQESEESAAWRASSPDHRRRQAQFRVKPNHRVTRAERAEAVAEYEAAVADGLYEGGRPRTRGDCAGGPRPCPWATCRHHLAVDVGKFRGGESVRLAFPDRGVEELAHTCALDVADAGGATLIDLGAAMNLTRERVRQILEVAVRKFARGMRRESPEEVLGVAGDLGAFGARSESEEAREAREVREVREAERAEDEPAVPEPRGEPGRPSDLLGGAEHDAVVSWVFDRYERRVVGRAAEASGVRTWRGVPLNDVMWRWIEAAGRLRGELGRRPRIWELAREMGHTYAGAASALNELRRVGALRWEGASGVEVVAE